MNCIGGGSDSGSIDSGSIGRGDCGKYVRAGMR
jgi:hypothetical protein